MSKIDTKLTRITRWFITKGVNAHVLAVGRAVDYAAKRATVAADEHEIARWESTQANERKRAKQKAEKAAWLGYEATIEAAENELAALPRIGSNA